jgi:type I restriction enzyme, R subunit
MIVCMSRRICADSYDAIVELRPDWHSDDDTAGKIKVVIAGSAADGPELNKHVRYKQARHELKERAKNPDDELELVIVRDMWLTGFDSPAMHTMYVARRLTTNPHPNLPIELLKRLLNAELKTVGKRTRSPSASSQKC